VSDKRTQTCVPQVWKKVTVPVVKWF